MSSFKNLNLIQPLLRSLEQEGYSKPTSIQEQAIPVILSGKDILGCAQTGTGKTAAFALPILQLLSGKENVKSDSRKIKALILTPTRELALQIGESFQAYGKYTGLRHAVIYGGVSQNIQTKALQAGVDILIATPGRLLDLIHQRFISLRSIEKFVLDEADRMLDMGFIHDIKKVLSMLPAERQSLFFSATMSAEIKKLAAGILVDPVKVEVTPVSSTAETVKQSVYYVDKIKKKSLLFHLLQNTSIDSVLVFTRTKHGADRVARELSKGGILSDAIHGGKSQGARQRALTNFKLNKIKVLVATDIAARGIDIEKLSYVINYEIPNEAETYVHRIGRTGRAGESGTAMSFCDSEEKDYLKSIVKLVGPINEITNHPFPSTETSGSTVRQAAPQVAKGKSEKSEKKKSNRWFKNKKFGVRKKKFAGNKQL